MGFLDPLQGSQTIELGHHDVEDDYVVVRLLDHAQRLAPVARRFDLVAAVAENAAAAAHDDFLVIYDQDSDAHELPSA